RTGRPPSGSGHTRAPPAGRGGRRGGRGRGKAAQQISENFRSEIGGRRDPGAFPLRPCGPPPPYDGGGEDDQRSAAAMLPPSTVITAPVVLAALASETKAWATSSAVTSRPKRLPPI